MNRDNKGRFVGKKFTTTSVSGKVGEFEYKIERYVQKLPDQGNNIQALGAIYLPCNSNNTYLKGELRFGTKLRIAGRTLYYDWGQYIAEKNVREENKVFESDRWYKAFEDAEKWCQSELQKLVDAISERKKALVDAELID